jgi:hypothetical protein
VPIERGRPTSTSSSSADSEKGAMLITSNRGIREWGMWHVSWSRAPRLPPNEHILGRGRKHFFRDPLAEGLSGNTHF